MFPALQRSLWQRQELRLARLTAGATAASPQHGSTSSLQAGAAAGGLQPCRGHPEAAGVRGGSNHGLSQPRQSTCSVCTPGLPPAREGRGGPGREGWSSTRCPPQSLPMPGQPGRCCGLRAPTPSASFLPVNRPLSPILSRKRRSCSGAPLAGRCHLPRTDTLCPPTTDRHPLPIRTDRHPLPINTRCRHPLQHCGEAFPRPGYTRVGGDETSVASAKGPGDPRQKPPVSSPAVQG